MARDFPTLSADAMKAEFDGAKLPDERLSSRLENVIELMSKSAGSSFARMCSTEAEREGLYRFLRNERIDPRMTLTPHLTRTVKRAGRSDRVLVIHDSTDMRLADEAEVESWLTPARKGFLAHVSLVVDEAQERRPLGLAALQTIERKRGSKTKKNGQRMRGAETAKLKNKEYDRWLRGVQCATSMLADECEELVHVMDAEADSYALLASIAPDTSFVVRCCHNRRAKGVQSGAGWTYVREVVEEAKEFKRTREVHVSKRRARREPQAAKSRPARDARQAQLAISFTKVVLRKPSYLSELPEELELFAVRAYEKSPPRGAEPIDWLLLTNLNVFSKASAERVIDIYRQRWLIEEYFKALKTGCGFRKRRLTNRSSIYNSLSLLAPLAWRALLLRQNAQHSSSSAADVFSPLELRVLRARATQLGKPFDLKLDARTALTFLAQLGGHRPSNGPPGWETLINGLQKLESLAEGWALRESLDM